MQPLDRFDADHAFVLGLMRKKRRAGDVANGINSRHAGSAEAIDDDSPPLGLNADFFQSEIFDVADHADRRDDALDSKLMRAALAVVDGRGNRVALLVELRHFSAGGNLDALLLEALARESGDLGILRRKDLGQHLDHRHFATERAVEGRKFDSNRAGTNDQQRFRNAIRHHGFEICPHQFLVGLEAEQHARARARRQDDVLGLIGAGTKRAFRRFASAQLHDHSAGSFDRRLAPEHGDFVFLHQKADAVVQAL